MLKLNFAFIYGVPTMWKREKIEKEIAAVRSNLACESFLPNFLFCSVSLNDKQPSSLGLMCVRASSGWQG